MTMRLPILATALLTAAWLTVLPAFSRAADPTFLGALALALEDEVAERLELDDATRAKLAGLAAEREDEALEMAVRLRSVSQQEQAETLAGFVAESERKAYELLSEDQRTRLEEVRIARAGLRTLGEPKVAEALELDAGQRERIEALLKERAKEVAGGSAAKRRLAEAQYERMLAAVLTAAQRAAWEQLAGQPPAASELAGQPPEPAAADAPAEDSPPNESLAQADAADLPLRFNFRFAPWKDVLDWFAEEADLSLVLDAPPAGTFNYSDNRQYTPREAIDLLNSVLLTKGYTLVRRDRMLMLINLEDGVPPNLVPQIKAEDLDERGEYELVSCLFQLERMTPEEAEQEISKLLGPQGALVMLPAARQIYVTETAGKLRTIRDVISAAEKPEVVAGGSLFVVELEHIAVDQALVVIRQLLGLPPEQNASSDGVLRIAVDPVGARLLITAKADQIKRIEEIVQLMDVPGAAEDLGGGVAESPQLEVYALPEADPESVLQVLQTIVAGRPQVRLAIDPKTGNLVAMGLPADHATIRATIEQMQKDGRQVEVIRLQYVDPQVAVLSINRLFGGGEEGAGDRNAPQVDADPISRQLLIRGTEFQITQIRSLLEKMGESGFEEGVAGPDADRGTLRMVPITGHVARTVLKEIQSIWPATRPNKIRVVTPSAVIRTVRPRGSELPPIPLPDGPLQDAGDGDTEGGEDSEESDAETSNPDEQDGKSAARSPGSSPFRFVVQQSEAASEASEDDATPSQRQSKSGAEIVVAPGPGGIVIASEDTEALDAFEDLLLSLAERAQAAGPQYTIFYLKYAKADAAAELLTQILGGGSGSSEGGGSLLGDIAGAALGDSGGMLGTLLGLGGGGGGSVTTAGPVAIVADNRLNVLVAQGNPDDLDTVEQLLQIIDQQSSPENVQTIAPPRLIPVLNTDAEEIAGVVRQVYSERIRGATGQQRQPSPEEFIRALRGSRGGRESQSRSSEDQQKMSIGVDTRSNSLIVSAPDPLFREVEALVRELDRAGVESNQAVRVVAIKRASPELVQRALASIIGPQVRSGTSSVTQQGESRSGQRTDGGQNTSRPATSQQLQDQIRQRIEFFNALQRAGGGGGGGDPRSRFGRGGPGGGGPGGLGRGGEGGRPPGRD